MSRRKPSLQQNQDARPQQFKKETIDVNQKYLSLDIFDPLTPTQKAFVVLQHIMMLLNGSLEQVKLLSHFTKH